jgi:hypothetical protein
MFGFGGSVCFTAAQEVTGSFTNTCHRDRISVRQSKLHVTDIPSRTKVEEEVGRESSECQRSPPAVHGGLERGDAGQRTSHNQCVPFRKVANRSAFSSLSSDLVLF